MTGTTKIVFLLAASSLISAACRGRDAEPPPSARPVTAGSPHLVATAPITRGSAGVVTVPAQIRSRQLAVISARLSALVLDAPFREGDSVRAGATLARLDDTPQRAALAAAQASLATAENQSRRLNSLLAKGAATPHEVEEIAGRLAAARAALAAARDVLNSASVKAPFDGRIVSKWISAGDLARSGAPLFELQGGAAVEVVATLESAEARSIRIGQKLQVRIDGFDQPVEATIHSIAPAADEATHRVDILCNVAAGVAIKPGLFARLELPAGSEGEGGLLTVPGDAVLRRGGLTGVFVVKDGRAWLRWVALGRGLNDGFEVRAGLDEGERVVLGPSSLTDGVAVSERDR